MGDAAMALYGTPVPIEDPVKSAVNAAMQIQQVIAKMMPKWKNEGLPHYGIGIGINFQDVVVGNVGSARLSNFTAIGDGVNIASRLCAIANAGEILISESCFEKLEWQGHYEKRTGLVIKGKAEPITAYAISSSLSSVAETCPSCNAPLPSSARFCGSCGYRRQ
jgi:adenylate cyclase